MKALLARIPWLRIGLVLLLLCVFQLFRWQIVTGNNFTVYRLDRLTGTVEMSMAGQEWKPIKSPVPDPGVNEWGDPAVKP